MIYLACYKEPSFTARKSKLMGDVKQVQTSLGGDEIYPLLKGKGNFRYGVADSYKGNRDDSKLTEEGIQLKEWVKELTEWAGENLGMACDNAEADDYVGILNSRFIDEGHTVIMSHIDKDLNQLIGHHHNFKKNETYTVDSQTGYHWLCKQTLMGDAADNIEGLAGIGIKTAEKMLASCTPATWWDVVCKSYQQQYRDEWEERLRVCGNLVFMRTLESDLRNLSFEEIKDIYTWTTTWGIGLSAQTQETCQQTSSDLSTRSSTELQEEDTSERNKSTATPSSESLEKLDEPRQSKSPSGESTPAVVSRSTRKSNRKAKTTSNS